MPTDEEKLTEFEKTNGVRFLRKDLSPLMRAVAWVYRAAQRNYDFNDFNDYWTAYRLPFGRATIAYPPWISDPLAERWAWIRDHELIHVAQQRSALGLPWSFLLYFFFPLPVFFSGRWFIEREAYLGDIARDKRTINEAVDQLWSGYLWPWPRGWMFIWFERRLDERTEMTERSTPPSPPPPLPTFAQLLTLERFAPSPRIDGAIVPIDEWLDATTLALGWTRKRLLNCEVGKIVEALDVHNKTAQQKTPKDSDP